MPCCAAIPSHRLAPGWLLLAACGLPSPSNSTTTTGDTDGYGDADGEAEGVAEDDDDAEPVPCEVEIASLVPFVTRPDGGCSVVLRLHHETLEPLGHQATCAARRDDRLDEMQARALTDCCTSAGELLDRPSDAAPWVFLASPGEAGEPGHVAVVSELVGARVLEASIARDDDGMGDLAFPETWLGPDGLGSACGPPPLPELRGHDLVEGGPLAEERLDTAWAVVSATALPFAMTVMGQLERVVVIRYPRRIDPFDASTAEYLVVLEGGAISDPAPED